MRSYTPAEIATLVGATLIEVEPEIKIFGAASLERATSSDVAFLENPRYAAVAKKSSAGLICLKKGSDPIEGRNLLFSDSPSKTFQKILDLLFDLQSEAPGYEGIHPTAFIHPSAKIAQDVMVGPFCVIEKEAIIDSGARLFSHVVVGAKSHIGKNATLYNHVVVRAHCKIGASAIIEAGAVIGSAGFGYLPNAQGELERLTHYAGVTLEEKVEIGANTTIDRGRFEDTKVAKGSKIDNLVQIAHNVEIGPHNILAAQVGIAGSTTTGARVVLGGQVGVIGHIHLGDGLTVAAQSGISKSLPGGAIYNGSPALGLNEYNRIEVVKRKLPEILARLKKLEEAAAVHN